MHIPKVNRTFALHFVISKRENRLLEWWNGRHEGLKILWPLRLCGFESRFEYQKVLLIILIGGLFLSDYTMNIEEKYMRRALQLAARGRGNTSPNPMVGAVIVNNGKIIGEGYHRRCGEPHAEVNAVASVSDKSLLKSSTIYVTLEPCAHYGKTPPCAQLIIDNHIPRVVIGCLDPFDKVSGRGVEMMRSHGIEVTTGLLEKECRELNAQFIISHTLHRPWVTLKWAQSADNFMDHKRLPDSPAARFSTPLSSLATHKLRALHDGIMAGSETIIADNPNLNLRLYAGNNPTIIVADRRGRISPDSSIFKSQKPIIYLTSSKRDDLHNTIQIEFEPNATISDYLHTIYTQGITSILVEGGSTLLQKFLDSDLWDMARVETKDIILGQNGATPSPKIMASPSEQHILDGNKIDIYYRNNLCLHPKFDICNFV